MIQKLRNIFLLSLFLLLPLFAMAQPANDDCSNAALISIRNNGLDTGVFYTDTVDLTNATKQISEPFHSIQVSSGNDKKTVWYKFEIGTARSLRVTLKQNGTGIPTSDVGFTTYKTENGCFPTLADIDSAKLTPLNKFGNSYNPCVLPGTYYIQLSAKASANDSVYLKIELLKTGITNSYDFLTEAYEYGLVNQQRKNVTYEIGCHTIEDTLEYSCLPITNNKNFTQSSWHTFKTDSLVDYIGFYLRPSNNNWAGVKNNTTIGIRVFLGNAKTMKYDSLTQIDTCSMMDIYSYWRYKEFTCSIPTDTVISVQLIFHSLFEKEITFEVRERGGHKTLSPNPKLNYMNPNSHLGILPKSTSGVITFYDDYFSCNSFMQDSINFCGMNKNDTVGSSKRVYDMASWFDFELDEKSNVFIQRYSPGAPAYNGTYGTYYRIFSQKPHNDCDSLNTNNMILESKNFGSKLFNCLAKGKYTVQILGNSKSYISYYPRYENYSQLGKKIRTRIIVFKRAQNGYFSLADSNKIDSVWALQQLQKDTFFMTKPDTFGCEDNVMPGYAMTCNKNNYTKASYRLFNIKDSGIVNFSNLKPNYYLRWEVFKGNARQLSINAGKFSYPDTFSGLKRVSSPCKTSSSDKVCLTPGIHTFVHYGRPIDVGVAMQPRLFYTTNKTVHTSRLKAQDMGDLSATANGTYAYSDNDYFSCIDNPDTIDGIAPCSNSTKLIYRQFYIASPRHLAIGLSGYYSTHVKTNFSLFSGKATDTSQKLKIYKDTTGVWSCRSYKETNECYPLKAGWYTLVTYGIGPTYENNVKVSAARDIGKQSQFYIRFIKPTVVAKYNRPYKACKVNNGNPLKYLPATGTTYKRYFKQYNGCLEFFTCLTDTPLIGTACGNENRVAYYVFKVDTISNINIYNIMDNYFKAKVFPFDVRLDSSKLKTVAPIQPCLNYSRYYIQMCNLKKGTYTLVVYANDNAVSRSVYPRFISQKVRTSRFDHAINAYDFDSIPRDSTWVTGKLGDTNTIDSNWGASADFVDCSVGAQDSDPGTVCSSYGYSIIQINKNVYKKDTNNILYDSVPRAGRTRVRRNLWYTFRLTKSGRCQIKVEDKMPSSVVTPHFSVFKSDENGATQFDTLKAHGKVDSTLAQGLTLLQNNITHSYYCNKTNTVNFVRSPCDSGTTGRYYILVDDDYSENGEKNHHFEVSIKFEGTPDKIVRYDYYKNANFINGLQQIDTPYTDSTLIAGTYKGAKANFVCASRTTNDQNTCGNTTIWYKFKVGISGIIRLAYEGDGTNRKRYKISNKEEIVLMRETIPGDSTSAGLIKQSMSNYNAGSDQYLETCVNPGTYYLMLNGCQYDIEELVPVVWLIEEKGDFCDAPVELVIGKDTSVSKDIVLNCHTIGEAFGEDGLNMGCLFGPTAYKSSWYKVTITDTNKYDLTFELTENTTVTASQIRYRVLYGYCNAMTAGPCNTNALTQFTINCMQKGDYYIQVVSPVNATGTIKLKCTAKKSTDQHCKPLDPLKPIANFEYQLSCDSDTAYFTNKSSLGPVVKYVWDFGNGTKDSTTLNPKVNYPRADTVRKYTISLIVTNKNTNVADTLKTDIFIFPLPNAILGKDTSLCENDTIILDASYPGATYLWQNSSVSPSLKVTSPGTYWVQITTLLCVDRDTIVIGEIESPELSISWDKNCVGNLISFTDSTKLDSSSVTSVNYIFGDGFTADSTLAWHLYDSVAKYPVSLIVATDRGCITTLQDSIDIVMSNGSIATLPVDSMGICNSQDTLQLNCTSTSGKQYWKSIGTGTWNDDTLQSVVYTISAADKALGKFNIIVKASNQDDCGGKDTMLINISPDPVCDAGNYKTIRTMSGLDSALLGGSPSVTGGNAKYLWSPSLNLDDSSFSNPKAGMSSYNLSNQYQLLGTDTISHCFCLDTTTIIFVLPVELLDFYAKKSKKDVLLTWSTAMEINNSGFDIELSTDGITFNKIGFKETQNPNSNHLLNYAYLHVNAFNSGKVLQYRLKQIDANGSVAYSPIRTVSFYESKNGYVVNYTPNPFLTKVDLLIYNPKIKSKVNLTITDENGKIVKTVLLNINKGTNKLTLDLKDLASGIYFFKSPQILENSIKLIKL